MALYRVLAPLKTVEELDEMLQDVDHNAQALGMSDFADGHVDPPGMFADEVLLLEAWSAGQRLQAELEEMQACPGCQIPAYDWNGVCAVHG
ncbi:hypothetical protein ACG04R_16375 [Roseateles sp. BYS78W]|uniref:Uncharacterized protein n=1 Tax=Pelomonas candidula TaxID=3299025 RepID=A0ABW7HED0_9BURK